MNAFKRWGLIFCLCLISYPAAAAVIDESVPVLCAAITVLECGALGDCRRVMPEEVNLPRFFEINFQNKTVSAPGSDRTSEIKHLVRQNGSLIIQGPGQGSRAWSAVFDTESGKFTAAVADNQYSFSIFGACTPR